MTLAMAAGSLTLPPRVMVRAEVVALPSPAGSKTKRPPRSIRPVVRMFTAVAASGRVQPSAPIRMSPTPASSVTLESAPVALRWFISASERASPVAAAKVVSPSGASPSLRPSVLVTAILLAARSPVRSRSGAWIVAVPLTVVAPSDSKPAEVRARSAAAPVPMCRFPVAALALSVVRARAEATSILAPLNWTSAAVLSMAPPVAAVTALSVAVPPVVRLAALAVPTTPLTVPAPTAVNPPLTLALLP